jgi:ferredoxin
MNNFQTEIIDAIKKFTFESPSNRLSQIDGSNIYDVPLVGFADGDDPIFELYHKVVGEFHMMPRQVLVTDEYKPVSVIVWVLPIAKKTLLANQRMTEGCSLRWNHSRFLGDIFNNNLRHFLVDFLVARGYKAVAPVLTEQFHQVALNNGPASTWSERHMAYAAGLGTFSLTDALITKCGIAHRTGSVVCDVPLEATPRPFSDYREYCLYAHHGTCGECIKRCPVGALSANGHDKVKCERYLMQTLKPWLKKPGFLGDKYIGCGLCLTGVPCEHQIPECNGRR